MVMNRQVYQIPYIELCEEIIVERGFALSNMESIEDEEYPEIKW
jgi:hypothetical protein